VDTRSFRGSEAALKHTKDEEKRGVRKEGRQRKRDGDRDGKSERKASV
jgi:hypothetical protein